MVKITGNTRKAVIAGVNELSQRLVNQFAQDSSLSTEVMGYFEDRSLERIGQLENARVLGNLTKLADYVDKNSIDVIYISLPIRNLDRTEKLLNDLHDTTASIYFVPDVFVFDLIQARTYEINGIPAVALCETPFVGISGMLKRIIDILIASVAIILTAPLLLAIGLAVKLTSKGPAIFKQHRYGLDGREILVYKFRTMYVTEDSESIPQATRNDPRVTPLGAFLRRYSLDELPQLYNVLQGRMSVVGPRPHAVAHNETYRKLIKGYMIRHKVLPGITGLAQVSGLRGETSEVEQMEKRIELDLDYLRHWSLQLDIQIIFKTIIVVLRSKNAY
jgi:putative colanic acid biosynthesis UDP-glucose lipid carrier transferase